MLLVILHNDKRDIDAMGCLTILLIEEESSIRYGWDNVPEFIANITSEWSQMHEIAFIYIQLGKPTQNAFVERLNGTYRRGVLDQCIFENIDQVRELTQDWMYDCNHYRPHDRLGSLSPAKNAEINSHGAGSKRIKNNYFIKY